MLFGLGWPEIAVIMIVLVVIFGPKRLPEIGNALGKTFRGFKEEMNTLPDKNDDQENIE